MFTQPRQFQDARRREDQEEIRKLKILRKTQLQQAEALRRELDFLSHKGGYILPHVQAPLPPIGRSSTAIAHTHICKQGPGRPAKL